MKWVLCLGVVGSSCSVLIHWTWNAEGGSKLACVAHGPVLDNHRPGGRSHSVTGGRWVLAKCLRVKEAPTHPHKHTPTQPHPTPSPPLFWVPFSPQTQTECLCKTVGTGMHWIERIEKGNCCCPCKVSFLWKGQRGDILYISQQCLVGQSVT